MNTRSIPNVYAIVLNWNRFEETKVCIASLKKTNRGDFILKIIIVDNGSTDGSLERIQKIYSNDKDVLILKNKKNLGFAKGNNVGIKLALLNQADFILLINNDTEVKQDFISELIKTFHKNRSVGLLTPKIYFAKGYEFHKSRYTKKELGRVIWSAGGTVDWDNVFGLNRGVDEVDQGQYDEECEVDFATGACILINSNILKEVGIFNEKYFMYFEDTDLSVRIRKSGFKIIYSPRAIIWHKVAQSSGIGNNLNDYFITRNRFLFGLKYASLRTKFALFRQSLNFLVNGRYWQKIGARDFYLGNFGKGSWKS